VNNTFSADSNQLGGDARGDFRDSDGAYIQSDRGKDPVEFFLRSEIRSNEIPAHQGDLSLTADHTDIGHAGMNARFEGFGVKLMSTGDNNNIGLVVDKCLNLFGDIATISSCSFREKSGIREFGSFGYPGWQRLRHRLPGARGRSAPVPSTSAAAGVVGSSAPTGPAAGA